MKSHHRIILAILVFIYMQTGCTEKSVSFSREKWDEWDGHYHSRKDVIKDVMDNHLKKGVTYHEVVKLLGESRYKNFSDELNLNDSIPQIIYEIEVKYKSFIDPYEGKDLIIKFGKDSLVTEYKLVKWQTGDK